MSKKTKIIETVTGKVIVVKGDIFAGMKACIKRNKNPDEKWRLQINSWLSPEEYPYFLEEEIIKTSLEEGFYNCNFGYDYGNHGYILKNGKVLHFTSQNIKGISISECSLNTLELKVLARKSTFPVSKTADYSFKPINEWLWSMPQQGYYSFSQLQEKNCQGVIPEELPEEEE